jgi:hypothetical protein
MHEWMAHTPRRQAKGEYPAARFARVRREFRASSRWGLAVLLAIAGIVVGLIVSSGPTKKRIVPFAATSFWNASLPANAPLDPRSATYVSELVQQVDHYGPWMNTTQYSVPVYTVRPHQPTVAVSLDPAAGSQPGLSQGWRAVPLPGNAKPAVGSDAHLVVWQPSTDRMWEFWQLAHDGSGWHARWGGYMVSVSKNPGYYVDHGDWGASATSLPLLGGLIRISELKAGHIDHALALAVVDASSLAYSRPAERTDGNIASPDAIPEGIRFRLDPSLDIARLKLPPVVRMLAEAAQRYGIVVRDRSGAVTFYGEDPTPYGSNPYVGPHGFLQDQNTLRQFPWSHLRALQTDLHHVGS